VVGQFAGRNHHCCWYYKDVVVIVIVASRKNGAVKKLAPFVVVNVAHGSCDWCDNRRKRATCESAIAVCEIRTTTRRKAVSSRIIHCSALTRKQARVRHVRVGQIDRRGGAHIESRSVVEQC